MQLGQIRRSLLVGALAAMALVVPGTDVGAEPAPPTQTGETTTLSSLSVESLEADLIKLGGPSTELITVAERSLGELTAAELANVDPPDLAAAGGSTLLQPRVPVRVIDTRDAAQVQGGVPLEIPIAGRFDVPSTGVAAVSLNLTIVRQTGAGYATVYPCGQLPTASTINFTSQIIANAVIAPLSATGSICVFSTVSTDIVIDLNGWIFAGAGFTPLVPGRILDTRLAIGQPGTAPLGATQGLTLAVAGRGGIPATGATALSLNVTVDAPQAAGFVTAYPCGGLPTVSNLNYSVSQTVANAVVIPVSANGTICLYTTATTHLVVDVNGWFDNTGGFSPLAPNRLLDTRSRPLPNPCYGFSGTDASGEIRTLDIATFAAGNDCSNWSFAVTTYDNWLSSTLNPLLVLIDVDGNPATGCEGGEYAALGFWSRNAGRLLAGVYSESSCDTPLTLIGEAGLSRTGSNVNNIAITFPAWFLGSPRQIGWLMGISPFSEDIYDFAPENGMIGARLASNHIPAATPYELTVAGVGGVPASGASAVWLNVTVTDTYGGGFATVYPCASPRPLASNLNYGNRATVPNAVLAPVDANGKVCLYAQQETHFVVDVAGWFA